MYIGNQPVLQTSEFREEFTATAGQTVFNTLGFAYSTDSAFVEIFRNGVLLGTEDYTLGTDGTTVTLSDACSLNDIVLVKGRRAITQGISITESRTEYTWQSGDTYVQLNADIVPGYTDVYLNGVKLPSAEFSIDTGTKRVTFTTTPSIGDEVSVVYRTETSSLVALPLKDSAGNNVLSESAGEVSLSLSGDLDVTGELTLGTALAVAEGGTGVTSLGSLDAADLGSGAATDGYVLTADGAGGTAWEAASGGGGGTVSGRNLIINGDFRVNQRGAASRTENTNAYNYDRWYYDGTYLYQVIEDLNVVNGDYIISWSGSGLTAGWVISSNTTSSIPASFNTVTSGSSFTVSGKTTGDHLWIRFNGTLANLADVQVEAGTVATPFERRPYGTELALCQRYYQKYSGLGLVFYGYWDATNTAVLGFNYPVTPRIPPTGIIVSSASHFFINNSAVGNPTANAIAFGSSSASTLDLSATVASGGACCGKSCKMISNNTSAFIELTGVEL